MVFYNTKLALQRWLIGEGIDAAEQFSAPKGPLYSLLPPRTARKECYTPTRRLQQLMGVPIKHRRTFHSRKNQLPRRVMDWTCN
ncbi:hypothetical protein ZWY2020_046377 [Hordeum vulgare]|nr:hypothetical protein ZWY2020_046377 [Hordeum vulgare]